MPADAARIDKAERPFVTPEGVDLRLNIGDAGQRAAAFLLDAAIIMGVLIAFTLALIFTGVGAVSAAGQAGAELVAVLWLVVFFLLRNFYFTAFELSAAAATPGKRAMGLRVASRDGGRLRAESVFARNAMRELEVFLPLSLLVTQAGQGGVDSWMYLLAFVWAAIFVFFPLFNRDRLRLGDLVGGTWVVRTPRRKLTRDMADDGSEQLARYDFTLAQLDAYGAKELHVLESILRTGERKTMRAVADRIMGKIGWSRDPHQTDRAFLSAYYAAVRGRLEQKLLMGVRRRDKHDV
ncbi:RDD family protein [Brevundimonas sp. LPMIX5]|uniref:RDD family protein n=1 Tax=Brevundimonas sp. LPMIX5 TaxID=2305887 RepID=UPI001F32083B|nr:RDD family protein [Brevundimonas sp. LPMIX5]